MGARRAPTITATPGTGGGPHPGVALMALPWYLPIADWPDDVLAALPRGISRHVVRFAHLGDAVVAVKETSQELALREYHLLRALERKDVPSVEPIAVVSGRTDEDGNDLPAALVTRHLRFSLPYRAAFSRTLRRPTLIRLMDALALLMVQLHLEGFFWGDVSLSNVLFRRDAGAFSAYLVDAETGELHQNQLSRGQREHDLDVARVNVGGELLDLLAGGMADPDVDPAETGDLLVESYRRLWKEVTQDTEFAPEESWRIEERIRRLNELGFDVEEYDLIPVADGNRVALRPKVVDPGHHQRRLMSLTGLDVQENQARRLLQDIDANRRSRPQPLSEHEAAQLWLVEVFEPITGSVPQELRHKLEPAEIMHQILEHRWYLSEAEQREATTDEAVESYFATVLPQRRDEDALILHPTTTMLKAVPAAFASAEADSAPEQEEPGR
ncbi:MAG: DUF4032 domain-containing protein [Micrococcus sp.]|nr:DUF4032 domain-containing protein [Micrococcus sp.]